MQLLNIEGFEAQALVLQHQNHDLGDHTNNMTPFQCQCCRGFVVYGTVRYIKGQGPYCNGCAKEQRRSHKRDCINLSAYTPASREAIMREQLAS